MINRELLVRAINKSMDAVDTANSSLHDDDHKKAELIVAAGLLCEQLTEVSRCNDFWNGLAPQFRSVSRTFDSQDHEQLRLSTIRSLATNEPQPYRTALARLLKHSGLSATEARIEEELRLQMEPVAAALELPPSLRISAVTWSAADSTLHTARAQFTDFAARFCTMKNQLEPTSAGLAWRRAKPWVGKAAGALLRILLGMVTFSDDTSAADREAYEQSASYVWTPEIAFDHRFREFANEWALDEVRWLQEKNRDLTEELRHSRLTLNRERTRPLRPPRHGGNDEPPNE